MNLKHFGDSYDLVKKSLLHWLSPFGPWAAHPMFTHAVAQTDAAAFSHLLGVPLVSHEVLTLGCDRSKYLAACGSWRSIFLDPDTGVRLKKGDANRFTEFIFGDELVALAEARAEGLVVAFDQSLARGSDREQVQAKLDHFRARGIDGFAYISHASFLVLGRSSAIVQEARKQVLVASGLPPVRIIVATLPNITMESAPSAVESLRGTAHF
jgi:hypothetical protein